MSDDTPVIGRNSRRTIFGDNSPGGTDTFNGPDDFLDPLHIMHDTPNADQSFAGQLAKPGAAKDITGGAPPTQADASSGAIDDQNQRQEGFRRASTILSGGAGLLDEPNTYSASRSLLGS